MAVQRYPCGQCGAQLDFAPGTSVLKCQYCGFEQEIPTSEDQIEELDFHAYLGQHLPATAMEADQVLHCNNCAAEFTMGPYEASGACPFCGSHVIVPTQSENRIEPRSVLPFVVDHRNAREKFRVWIGSRFWAPNNLKELALAEAGLHGMYIPYWTYDSVTTTAYTGMRGEDYYETETYTENGETRTRQVVKTRWYPASGVVVVDFDDVLVLASNKLPPKYAQAMNSWSLAELKPYESSFLSGFQAMRYDVDLEQGFEVAKRMMEPRIDQAIRSDIGGDRQQINSKSTQYDQLTFKHILLPIWTGAYRYKGRSWSYLVNGQTGEVRGEAPVSWFKVAIAVILGLVVLGTILYLTNK